jgi:hypothetical protein
VSAISINKVGYCRSEVYFSGLCLVAAKVQPGAYATSKRSMALRDLITSIHHHKLKSDTLPAAIRSSCLLSCGWTVLQMKH